MVLADDEGKPYPTLQIRVRDGKVNPNDGRFVIDQLNGYVAVHDKDVQITEIKGKHQNADFFLKGDIPKNKPVSLVFTGEKIPLTQKVLDLIPPSAEKREDAQRIIEPLQLTGEFDMQLTLYNDQPETPWKSKLRLFPRQLDAMVREQPVKLTEMKGWIDIVGNEIQLNQLQCQYGPGHATISGKAEFAKAGAPRLDLDIDAQSDKFCQTTRAILPDAVVSSLDALAVDGKYHLEKSHLTYQPKSSSQPASYTFNGLVHLEDATAQVGVPITQMMGTMKVNVTHNAGDDLPQLKLDLDLDKLLASDRLISPMKVHMDNLAAKGQVLFIQQFSGQCYNGLLHGQGQVAMDDSAAYMVRLTLQNADYHPVIYPREPLQNVKPVDDALDRPTLSADLTISGMNQGKNIHRSGRGSIAIRNANIYQFPLTMSIVQLLNMATPTARQFNDADVQFLVDGSFINVENIELKSPTINIAGNGTMQYDTGALNLDLFTRNPGAPNLGPVTELMKMFKNELVGIHVGGTLENPVTSIKSLGGIRNTMTEILGKPSEKNGSDSQSDNFASPNRSGQ
jgi:hypothetical protein